MSGKPSIEKNARKLFLMKIKTERKRKKRCSRLHKPCGVVTVGDSKWPQCIVIDCVVIVVVCRHELHENV